jgi:predicted RNase H-like HicB family nuclease
VEREADVQRVQAGRRTYTVLLVPDEGGYAVEVPALPGCFTQGATREEALANAREAIRVHLRGLEQDGEPVPVETERPATELVEV